MTRGFVVSTALGLGPVYRLVLCFVLPEVHYVIEKHVYSSEENMEAAGNDLSASYVNSFSNHNYSSAANMEAAGNDLSASYVNSFRNHNYSSVENLEAAGNDLLVLDVNSLTYPKISTAVNM